MEESAAAERGSFDINEYEVVTPGDVLSPEEFKENPVEAQAVVDLAQNGLRQRPSSITMNELMSHEVALLPSNPLDKYRIEKSLGQGAFANVLLVEDTTTSDQFALKRIEVKDDAQKVKIVNEIFLM
jgi:serine/threonine protein kinase